MKKIFLPAVAATALLFTACGGEEAPAEDTETTEPEVVESVVATYNVDAAASTLEWKGTDTSDGHFHSGTVAISAGSVNTTDGVVDGGSATVDLTSIAYVDGGATGDSVSQGNLLGHISSAEIFNTAEMGTATFTITGADENGINGTLNVLGVDIAVTVPGAPTVDETSLTHSTDWFSVDLSSASGFFAEGSNHTLDMKLNLTANQ